MRGHAGRRRRERRGGHVRRADHLQHRPGAGQRGSVISKPFNPYAVLKAISNETLLVALAGLEIANGKTLPQEDKDRLLIAANRLREAYQICH